MANARKGRTRTNTDTVTLSGELLDRIFEHVSTTGEPLLRPWREDDVGHVSAWQQDDGSYELVDTHLNDFLNGCDGWEEFAEYAEIDVSSLIELLGARGYPWDLPDEDEDPDDWPAIDAFEAAEYIGDALPLSKVDSLRTLIPRTVRWDRTTKYPDIPRDVLVALEWLGGNGTVTVHDECWEMRGGSPSRFVDVPSAMALSCLQAALDQVGAKICIGVETG
jgi:hypothetical protein